MPNPIRLVPAIAVLALVAAVPAKAQDAGATPDAGAAQPAAGEDYYASTITIGGGGVYLPDYEGSNDYRFTAAPAALGSYKGFNFQVAGNRASIDLIPDGAGPTWDFQAGPVAVLDFNRSSVKNIDDIRVARLGQLKTAIELGGYVGIGKTGVFTSPYDKLSLSLSYRHDVSKVHRSGIWAPTLNYLTPLNRKTAVGIVLSAERAEGGYADTYYGITPAQAAASGLPAYNARGGWKNYTIGGFATYALTGDLLHGFKIVAGGTYQRLLNGFADSPVVSIAGSRNQWLGAVGVAYTF